MNKDFDRFCAVFEIALERGRQIIEHLKGSNLDEAEKLLTLRKAAIFNFFAMCEVSEMDESEFNVLKQVADKILLQNEIIEEQLEKKQSEAKDELRRVVKKRFQFKGYVGAAGFRLNSFEGKA